MDVGVFDLLTLGVAVVGYMIGRSRGLVWQLSGIATLVLGGVCATTLARPLGGLFSEGILGSFVAWVGVYALVATCLYVITLRLRERIKELEFEELDRRFGGMLGAFKGLFAFALVALVAASVSATLAERIKASVSGQGLAALVEELRAVVPERAYEALGPYPEAAPAPTPEPAAPEPPPGPIRPTPGPAPTRPTPAPSPSGGPPPPAPTGWDPTRPPDDEWSEATGAPPDGWDAPPPERRPTPDPPDPFDTSDDPPDPLAPPR